MMQTATEAAPQSIVMVKCCLPTALTASSAASLAGAVTSSPSWVTLLSSNLLGPSASTPAWDDISVKEPYHCSCVDVPLVHMHALTSWTAELRHCYELGQKDCGTGKISSQHQGNQAKQIYMTVKAVTSCVPVWTHCVSVWWQTANTFFAWVCNDSQPWLRAKIVHCQHAEIGCKAATVSSLLR